MIIYFIRPITNSAPPTINQPIISEKAVACENHANALATDYEIQEMQTGNGGTSDTIMTLANCRYYFFNPKAEIDPQLTEQNKTSCDLLRKEFHEQALKLQRHTKEICLSFE